MKNIEYENLKCNLFSVYDIDAKTVQELISKFTEKVNDCIDVSNTTIDLVKYLTEEGLKEEVAIKINEMFQNGDLENIINHEIFNQLLTKIEMNEAEIENNEMKISDLNTNLNSAINTMKEIGEVNVKTYGAIGNGVDDDTEAFKRALQELQIRGGGKLHVPYGTYLIDNIVVTNNINFVGESVGTTLKLMTQNTRFEISGSNIHIEDITFDGNMNNVVCGGFIKTDDVGQKNNISINRCSFKNFNGLLYNIIEINNATDVYITKNEFVNVQAKNVDCIKLLNVDDVSVNKNTFKSLLKHDEDSYVRCINAMDNSNNVVISDNDFKGAVSYHISAQNSINLNISNNRFMVKDVYNILMSIISLNNISQVDMFDNRYNVENTSLKYNNYLEFNECDDVTLKNDYMRFVGRPEFNNYNRPVFRFNKCNNIYLTSFKSTGRYYANSYIVLNESNVVYVNDCEITTDGGFHRFVDIVKPSQNMSFHINGNRLNIRLFNVLVANREISSKGYIAYIQENKVSVHNKFLEGTTSVIILYNITNVHINDNEFNGSIINLYDVDVIKLKNNNLGKIVVHGLKWKITSSNNIFTSLDKGCYQLELRGESQLINDNYSIISTNNINMNNENMIHFFNGGRPYQNYTNLNVQTIDDYSSDLVILKQSIFITREGNITSDLYRKCFVKTNQPLRKFTYFSATDPLFNYIKPHGLITYRLDNGLCNLYALVGKTNHKTQII